MANKNEVENLNGKNFCQLQDNIQGGRRKPADVSGSGDSLRENSVANGGSTDTLSSDDEVIAIRGRLRLRRLQKGKQPMMESSEEDEERWYIQNHEIDQNKDDQEKDNGDDEEEEEEADEQRPKLPKDFYVVEAIRKKRKYRGVTKYFIKWRGWPESSNTWEPIKNLQACTALIDAFEEERSKSGKRQPGRRGKHRHGVTPQSQYKEKKEEHKPAQIIKDSLPCGAIMDSLNAVETHVIGGNPEETPRHVEENVTVQDDISVHVQEPAAPESVAVMHEVASVDGNGASQSGRLIGARRRKSGVIKRINPESSSCAVENAQDEMTRTSTNKIQILGLDHNNGELPPLIKVTKCLEYYASPSDTTQEVAASFFVLRADGKQVFVSYKYLKTRYPLVLIDFYEQHLRFNATE